MAGLNLAVNVSTAQAISELTKLENSIRNVGATFKVAFAAATTGAVANFADSLTNLRNKLTTLNDSASIAAQQLNGLAAIAIRSRSDLAAVGDLYYKTARAADQLGISQQEAAQITETISKAMKAAGQAGNEAAGPLYQLGQAFQSGVFQGDELRSIMEGLGPVAKIIANEMGVTVGELKKLGAEGQITAEIVARAMLNARDQIENAFGKTIPTISDSLNTFKNLAGLAFNEFETNTQTAQAFSLAIENLAFQIYFATRNIDEFMAKWGDTIIMIGKVILAFTAFRAVYALLAGASAAALTLAGNLAKLYVGAKAAVTGMTALATGAATVGGAIAGLAGKVLPFARALLMAGSAIAGLFIGKQVYDGLTNFGDSMRDLKDPTSDASKELARMREEFNKVQDSFGKDKKPAPAGVVDAKVTRELERQTEAYKQQAAELERRLSIEGELIGVSDRTRTIRQAVADVDSTFLKEINKLNQEYVEKSKSKNKNDQAALPQIAAAMKNITEQYVKHRQNIEQITALNYDKAEQEKRDNAFLEFSLRNQIAVRQKIADLQSETANMLLPLLTQQQNANLKSAEEQARQAIESENTRRRGLKLTQMTADEEKKYYDQAKKDADLLNQELDKNNQKREKNLGLIADSRALRDLQKQLLSIEDQRAALTMTPLEKEYQKIDIAARNMAESEIEAYMQRNNLFDRNQVPGDIIAQAYARATAGAYQLKEAQAGLDYQSKTFATGWTQALISFQVSARDASQTAARLFNRSVQGMEDLFVKFAKTGKFEWKQFVNDLGEELLRSQLRELFAGIFGQMTNAMDSGKGILGTIGSLLGFGGGSKGQTPSNPLYVVDIASAKGMTLGGDSGGGGILSSIWNGIKSIGSSVLGAFGFGGGSSGGGSILGSIVKGIGSLFGGFFADGGTLGRGKFGIAGERGPELVTGPATITPLGGASYVTYNINAVDALSFKQMLARDPSYIHGLVQQGAKTVSRRY